LADLGAGGRELAENKTAAACLDGLVYGPHTATTLLQFVKRAPDHCPLRLYPDITHSLTTQFPVPKWDRALAMTGKGIRTRGVNVTETTEITHPESLCR